MTVLDEKTTEIEEKPAVAEDDTAQSVEDIVREAAAELAEPEKDTETEAAAEQAPEVEETKAEAPDEVEPAIDTAPDWWGGDVEVWSGLAPEVRETIEKREASHREAMEQASMPNEVQSYLDQVKDMSAAYGMTVEQGLARLVNANRMLLANPKHGLASLARDLGVDLAELGIAPDGDQTQQADPLLTQVDQLLQSRLGQFQQAQEQQQINTALSELERWAGEKDANGAPLRPYFEELQPLVKTEMDRLLAANPNGDRWDALDNAYKTVSRIKTPVTDMEAEIEKRAQEKADALLKANQAEVAKAKSAAVSPASSASHVSNDDAVPASVEDTVRQAAAELASSGGRI